MSAEGRKGRGIPAAGITGGGEAPNIGGGEAPNMGAGNWTQAVCKNSICP